MVEDWKTAGAGRLRRRLTITRDLVERCRLRLQSRLELVAVAGMLCLCMSFAGAAWQAGMLGFAAVLAYVLLQEAPAPVSSLARQRRILKPGLDSLQTSALVDAMPDPAWVLDSQGVVLHANAQAVNLFGSLRPGVHVSVATRDPDLITAVAAALQTTKPQLAELHQRVPVERRLLAIIAVVDADEAREGVAALLLTLRDLTAQDRLAQMRADFVANASHELRTPLASLRGFVETLQGSARDDAAARERFLGIMSNQAARMTRLIDDLLSLSRVEMREHVAPTASVDLVPIITQVLQSLEQIAAEYEIRLVFVPPDTACLVLGDRDELVQVFQNLVQNGIKYGRRAGWIDVRVEPGAAIAGRRARITVEVQDNGLGIAPEHLPRLTERFYRVNASQSRDKGGTGLGLAIVKHIVSRHGGELHFTSKLGEGSCFGVILDRVGGAATPPLHANR